MAGDPSILRLTEMPEEAAADSAASPERVEAFVQLLGKNQRRIHLFVMTMVPNWSDAEEIIQETNLLLWREFDRFELGTNFGAWACRVALNQTLAWRKRKQRDRLQFSDDMLEAVAAEASAEAERLEERCSLLAHCIGKLPEQHRVLVEARYGKGQSIETIGDGLGRSSDAVYRALSRIRRTLHECVTRSLAHAHGDLT